MRYKRVKHMGLAAWIGISTWIVTSHSSLADEPVVYSVYRSLDLGNPGEKPQKDYYVNVGTSSGVSVGKKLEILRRISTYDLLSEKLYRDVTFPIAVLTVIHAESNVAIARLEKTYPTQKTPVGLPQAVMVGDTVRPLR